jgi:hypothetical protein
MQRGTVRIKTLRKVEPHRPYWPRVSLCRPYGNQPVSGIMATTID